MPELSNVELLRVWFRECPVINPDNRFRVDYLAKEPTEYALMAVPTSIITRENVLGEEIPADIQTINYIFAVKESYGSDSAQNASNLAFLEAVSEWIFAQNALRNFPALNDGKVKSIVPTLTGFPAEVGSDTAKYQIQLKITYKRNA